jgi:hypothetical protein
VTPPTIRDGAGLENFVRPTYTGASNTTLFVNRMLSSIGIARIAASHPWLRGLFWKHMPVCIVIVDSVRDYLPRLVLITCHDEIIWLQVLQLPFYIFLAVHHDRS